MVRNDSTMPHSVEGRAPLTNEQFEPTNESPNVDLAGLTDAMLVRALSERQEAVKAAEAAFGEARAHLETQRRGLRAIQVELQRRLGAGAGQPGGAAIAGGARRRSTTTMDAILGRDGIDAGAALYSFRFLSLQREEVLLDPAGEPDQQAIRFVDKGSGEQLLARTFGEARSLLEAGHGLGQPGIPLQRQDVWYVERGRPARLRLDQVFVERRGEST